MISTGNFRRWRIFFITLMMLGFFGPWMTSCGGVDRWGNTPHYLVEYGPSQSAGIPMIGPGYVAPEVYYGFEVVWIYLLGWFKFLGIHTIFFSMGLAAISIFAYVLFNLAALLYGVELRNRWARNIKIVRNIAIFTCGLCVIGSLVMAFMLPDMLRLWHFAGLSVTFAAFLGSLILDFKYPHLESIVGVRNPALWFRSFALLFSIGIFAPLIFFFQPLKSKSELATDCVALKEFKVPEEKWSGMDEASLQLWIEENPNFDNFTKIGPFANTNDLDYMLHWFGFVHKAQYEAYFTDHYLNTISAYVPYGITFEVALECFGEPEAYLAVLEDSSTGFDSLLIQLWYPNQGVVLEHSEVGDDVKSTKMDENLIIDGFHFVQPGSVEAIASRAYLIDSSWLFPGWVEAVGPWPGYIQAVQIKVIIE